MSHRPALIDPHVFDELQAEAGADFVLSLVDTFAEEGPVLLAELHAAAEGGAAERFRRAAHSLKSNAATFGALPLAEQARSLEHAGLPVTPAQLQALAQGLHDSVQALQTLARG